MTTDQLHLDVESIRSRRIALNISSRVIAGDLGMAEAGYRRLESGLTDEHLTITQLGRLAAALELDPATLLRATPKVVEVSPADSDSTPDDEELVALLGPLLQIVGRAVSIAALAEVVGADTTAVTAALERLKAQLAPGGLVVSIGKPGVTLVPAHSKLGAQAVRQLLRQNDNRGAMNTPGARLLHVVARGSTLPQVPKQAERQQLSILVRAGWLHTPAGRSGAPNALALHPDVAFSLVLDDGEPTERASTTVFTAPTRRKQFTWLDDAEIAPAHPDVEEVVA